MGALGVVLGLVAVGRHHLLAGAFVDGGERDRATSLGDGDEQAGGAGVEELDVGLAPTLAEAVEHPVLQQRDHGLQPRGQRVALEVGSQWPGDDPGTTPGQELGRCSPAEDVGRLGEIGRGSHIAT